MVQQGNNSQMLSNPSWFIRQNSAQLNSNYAIATTPVADKVACLIRLTRSMPSPTTTFTYRVESDKPLLAAVARMYVASMAVACRPKVFVCDRKPFNNLLVILQGI